MLKKIARKKSTQAIQTVRQQFGQTYFPLINGEYVQTENFVDSLNPSKFSQVVGKMGFIER